MVEQGRPGLPHPTRSFSPRTSYPGLLTWTFGKCLANTEFLGLSSVPFVFRWRVGFLHSRLQLGPDLSCPVLSCLSCGRGAGAGAGTGDSGGGKLPH